MLPEVQGYVIRSDPGQTEERETRQVAACGQMHPGRPAAGKKHGRGNQIAQECEMARSVGG